MNNTIFWPGFVAQKLKDFLEDNIQKMTLQHYHTIRQ